MKRLAYAAVCASMLLVLAGCGERPVDESLLPTRVPTLDPNTFAVAAVPAVPEPTATPVPVPTTLPTLASTTAPTATPTTVPTTAPEPTATPLPPEPTPAAAAAPATDAVTATAAVTSSGDLTAITATTAVTDTGAAAAATELPPGIVAALAQADPMRGQMLTLSSGCIGCHSLDPNQVMPGPTWRNIGNVAATRVPGENADLYLYNSILHPNAYVVEGFLPNIMLQIYQDTLTDQNVADLIAYLLSLKN